jgi:signal transduction histidine kinase
MGDTHLRIKTQKFRNYVHLKDGHLGLGQFGLALIVFLIGIVISLYYFGSNNRQVNYDLNTKFDHQIHLTQDIIDLRLQQYTNLLSGGAALFKIDSYPGESMWSNYYETYDLSQNYPGVVAVSFSQYVTSNEIPNYLNVTRSQVTPNFTITPAGNRPAYAPITYVSSLSAVSLKSLGFDPLTNPVRDKAISEAIKEDRPVMSGKISLVATDVGKASFLIYTPVYNQSVTTFSQRENSVYGIVNAAVNAGGLFKNVVSNVKNTGYGFSVYDGNSQSKSALMYQTPNFTSDWGNRLKQRTIPFTFDSHTWTIEAFAGKGLLTSNELHSPMYTLIASVFLGFLLALLIWYSVAYRERRLLVIKKDEVQLAKDDLLSLASHQLRTPATIVKQYLGILLQNYGGEIDPKHREIIQTAYDSNEKQLEIANQFLNVARLDSGRIKLVKSRIDLNSLIKKSVDEQRKVAKKRQQGIAVKLPKRNIYIEADSRYLPMAIENLLSNASKYTNNRGRLTISAATKKDEIRISVKDNGIGIEEHELDNLFDKFSRIEKLSTTDFNGTGIGLYLTKQIVDLHGGSIDVESIPKKGSTFTIHLPKK